MQSVGVEGCWWRWFSTDPLALMQGGEVTIKFFDKGVDISKIIRCHSMPAKRRSVVRAPGTFFHKAQTPPPKKKGLHEYMHYQYHFRELFRNTTAL